MIALANHLDRLAGCDLHRRSGTVREVVGLTILASGPAVPVGELCRIDTALGGLPALVIGFRADGILLQPLGRSEGIRLGDPVQALGQRLQIPVGPGLVGRVVDGLGRPIDGRGPIPGNAARPIHAEPPGPLQRRPIAQVLETGCRAIDAVCTIGRGQRMGIFAGAGLGKSVLLSELATHARCDVAVIALVGERGREVGEFLSRTLGAAGLARSVVVAATSDRPPVERLAAAYAAQTIAEHFRDAGMDVLLMMDSVTRFCHAQREIGLAAGEPPTVRGYPPSSFALLPGLLERAGTSAAGSITAIYTVLVDGDGEDDPVAENVRAIIDGHLILSRQLADRGIYPAIDMGRSVSRCIQDLVPKEELALALGAREAWGEYERIRDLVEIGAYAKGADPRSDQAIAAQPKLLAFLRQAVGERSPRGEAMVRLKQALGGAP